MREFLKDWCVPGTVSYFAVMISATVPLLALRQTSPIGTALLVTAVVSTGLLTVPVVSELIAAPLTLRGEQPRTSGVEAVVLLIGDSTGPRISETLKVFQQFRPQW